MRLIDIANPFKKSYTFSVKAVLFFAFFFLSNTVNSQDTISIRTDSSLLNGPSYKNRQWLIGGLNVVGYGTSIVLFNNTWYKDYPKTSFHTFNDSKEWQQMDKVGHSWAAYNSARGSAAMWRWAGLPQKKAAWIGGLSSTAYLTVIEFLDAHSAEWGWSWADMGANLFGSGLFIAQELGWKEQRIQFKFSFHRNSYDETQLEKRADQLFGKSWSERMLKDYNAQTYWFSANLKSFFPKSKIPAWLNIAAGYGADGMFGGFENKWIDELGSDVTRYDIPRKRQFYLAPDIDFTKIPTKSKFLRTTFAILNSFKCPAPALMLDSKGKFKAYALYF
ncbi:MAG TPA: DUF2279 domain-containing protein [Chitinophagaceae bacterium]